jgi:autotransporter-associated beta strand protein
VIYSLAAPVSVTGVISGAQPTANVQIGATLGTGLEFTNSNVTLSGSSTFAGGTRLYCGTLNIGNSTTLNGQTITSGPLGTGTFFIGTAAAPGATEPTINAVGATRTIANPIVLSNNFTIGAQSPLILSGTVDLNAAARFVSVNSVATFSGAIIGASGSALIKDGAGTMQLSGSATHSGPTVVNAGTLAMLATQRLQGNLAIGPSSSVTMKPGGATFLTVPALTIDAANSGSLDLADDDAVIDYAPASPSPINSIAALIKTGYASAAWTGPGITSSSAASVAANIANTHKTAIGFAEASTFGIGTFAGQAVDTSAVLLRYTVVGDANIDGTVDTSDFNVLAANFNMTNALWQQGDFNFDGVVNALDFNNLSNNFGQILPSPALGSVVPEPAVLAPLVLISLLRRRRK